MEVLTQHLVHEPSTVIGYQNGGELGEGNLSCIGCQPFSILRRHVERVEFGAPQGIPCVQIVRDGIGKDIPPNGDPVYEDIGSAEHQ